MELTGDLSDFALTDILQILALSRKTGTLSLDTESVAGKIVIHNGRITYAAQHPGRTLADSLAIEKGISPEALESLKAIGVRANGVWTLHSLIVESGIMSEEVLERAVKRYINDVVAGLVALEKGRFGIELNQADVVDMNEVRLKEGLDVGEVLLEAAKERDESHSRADPQTVSLREWLASEAYAGVGKAASPESYLLDALPVSRADLYEKEPRIHDNGKATPNRASLLCSLLAELRSHSFEAEISLLIMRYASEVANRGVLFVLKDNDIMGLGQFGVKSRGDHKSADEKVREIHVPLGANSIFDEVVRSGQPYIGEMPGGYWNEEILCKIGGHASPLSVFLLPLMCQNRPVFLIYGDNYPGVTELTQLDELVALVNQASIVLEKIVLERIVSQLQLQHGGALVS